MCGIAGEFAFEREQVTAAVSRMIAALCHRGPDSSGHYISPAKNVLLVNTRLAIVDVGDGTQPLTNEDGAVWITFNGEIYGFAALARQLERRGPSSSDPVRHRSHRAFIRGTWGGVRRASARRIRLRAVRPATPHPLARP